LGKAGDFRFEVFVVVVEVVVVEVVVVEVVVVECVELLERISRITLGNR
jgi:hypothetical protein